MSEALIKKLRRVEFWQADCEVRMRAAAHIEELESSIRELFTLLDKTEDSDEGRVFHPNRIQSCRAVDAEKLEQVLSKLKGAI